MITVKSAIKKIQSNTKVILDEVIHIKESSDRTLSHNYNSSFSNPPFNVSSMDGYACKLKDLKTLPIKLNLIGISSAGKNFNGKIKKNETVRVLTGAKIPEGSDIVIIQENTSNKTKKSITVNKINKNSFIRKKGMDFKNNDNWAKPGFPIKIKDIALGCAMNIEKIKVKKKPNVAILSTGDELVNIGKKTKDFQIISSSSIALKTLIESFGANVTDLGICKDNKLLIKNKIKNIKNFDLLVTIGGASVGDKDLVKSSLLEKGFNLIFWRIAMRPGKPVFFGLLNKVPIIGLPGNPVSSYICSLIFVKAAIHKMLDRKDKIINESIGILGSDLKENDEREDYIRAKIKISKDNERIIYPHKIQDSSMLSILAKADCIIRRPPNSKKVNAGAKVSYIELK